MEDAVYNPLADKLCSFTDLSTNDRAALDDMVRDCERHRANTDIISEGDRPDAVIFMIEGWACRYKVLADGNRQIMAYLLPGDLCDPHVFILDRMDHSIALLTDAKLAFIPKDTIIELTDRHPAIGRALWWATLVDEAVLRHWLLNNGQRDAYARIAHLFCELWDRLTQVNLRHGNQMEVPLTQEQLGDTMGLTGTHVNRTIGRMREEGLIEMHNKNLRILDIDRLREVAEYDPTYLHQHRRTNA
ncbi:cAMP-binding domain of CRP or a regulatory subunit of cAMP-dependent protein kinases [Sphingomonas palmae]|uniref:cAMP-binding domain of CRP or a regulatory subunit of cAMP-dependent protein kinases n=1 Tax=Sphingomonas palmae TaxID=1855283 RepID=A0A1H7J7P6_9SPHN|nr:Crp/Fnr family transcriptional regulator [Sphingomonas palmae]SEK70252.1 cAMP-binding domain of CRP or a regulatory subunit of cAMP-dependent protein kinases [Sphingomonas palmae]